MQAKESQLAVLFDKEVGSSLPCARKTQTVSRFYLL